MATATNKNYLVIGGDGAELKTVKTLAAAKKLADAEGGSVLEDGKCIYTTKSTPEENAQEKTEKEGAEEKPEKYRIKTLMNIRREPGLTGEKLGIAKQGAIVSVKRVKDDWLHLTDGTFILFGGGEFAEKA
ncbi:MAG: hypothetical protein IIZ39_14015 [Blautia sp.]|nr:hypothetical protein [Blautia sp.]